MFWIYIDLQIYFSRKHFPLYKSSIFIYWTVKKVQLVLRFEFHKKEKNCSPHEF